MSKKFKKILFTSCILLFLFITVLYFTTIKDILKETSRVKSTQASFDTFTNEMFKSEVVSNTLTLHYTLENPAAYGIEDYPITFGSLSDESIHEANSKIEEYLQILDSFEYKNLTASQQLTYDLLYDYYSTALSSSNLVYYSETLSPTIGTQAQLPVLLAEYRFNTEQDVVDYLTLLSQMDEYYTSIIDFEEKKSDLGLFMSTAVTNDIISQCNDFISDADNNFLIETFNTRINSMDSLSESAKANYRLQNKSILYNDVIPAYQILVKGLTSLENTCVNTQGLCYFEDGQDYYEYLVKSNTGSSKSIFELKELLNTYMQTDLQQMSEIISDDPSIFATADSYNFDLSDPSLILEDLKLKISSDFPTPPSAYYTVKYVDSSLSKHLSPAFYLTPPIDNISENLIYINPESNYSKIDLYTTLAHEGYPGHLYQNIYFNANNVEPIRNLLNYGGYSEGWATYVEMYSYRFADIDSNLAALLQLNNAVTLYLYANMDIGINYYGWTLEDTASYLSNFGFDDADMVSEIYCAVISEPSNYLKYCIGYIEFSELKKTAKETLGSDFNIKDFHKFILDMGPAPFYILEKYMDTWMTGYNN